MVDPGDALSRRNDECQAPTRCPRERHPGRRIPRAEIGGWVVRDQGRVGTERGTFGQQGLGEIRAPQACQRESEVRARRGVEKLTNPRKISRMKKVSTKRSASSNGDLGQHCHMRSARSPHPGKAAVLTTTARQFGETAKCSLTRLWVRFTEHTGLESSTGRQSPRAPRRWCIWRSKLSLHIGSAANSQNSRSEEECGLEAANNGARRKNSREGDGREGKNTGRKLRSRMDHS